MAQYFKKRTRSGPNKNEQKVARAREAASKERQAGLLKERFPEVQRVRIHLEFKNPQGQTLDTQSREFGPEQTPDFAAPCPGRCGTGSFALDGKLQTMVEGRQPLAEVSGTCQEPLYAGAAEHCGLKLQCRIEVVYSAAAAATLAPAPTGPAAA